MIQVTGPKIHFVIPIFGGIPITQTAIASFVVMLILCISGFFLGRNLKKRPSRLQVVTEKLVSMIYGLVEETMGKHNSHWTPYIATLFLSSILGSLIGMTGFLRSTTADLSTVIVWALMTSFLVWGNTIRYQGLKAWLKGYINPLNIVSDIAQPVSMAFRHFGNIMGGGVLTSLMYSALAAGSTALLGAIASSPLLVSMAIILLGGYLLIRGVKKKKLLPKIFGIALAAIGLFALLERFGVVSGIPILSLGLPAVLSLYFDLFSGFVQALVFSLLTMVYVGIACPPKESTLKEK
ncbi:MAG: F0F1 ATP synthase subunit A [Oscillospiraceae bacterium]|nr:F0F1 ATP synthase subunit A [Oscillospiraceae bacterium]